jgi:hypothetical protein
MSTSTSGLPQSYAAKLAKSVKLTRENKAFLAALKKKPLKKLDDIIHHFHQQTFERIDCLQCANCCKTTSPIFYDKDKEITFCIDLRAHFLQPTIIVESMKPVPRLAANIPTRTGKECTKF